LNSIEFFIIYVATQQPYGQLRTEPAQGYTANTKIQSTKGNT